MTEIERKRIYSQQLYIMNASVLVKTISSSKVP